MARTRRKVPLSHKPVVDDSWTANNPKWARRFAHTDKLAGNDGVFQRAIGMPNDHSPKCFNRNAGEFWTPHSKRWVKSEVVRMRRRKAKQEIKIGLGEVQGSADRDAFLQQLVDFNEEFRADVDRCIAGDLVLDTYWYDPEYQNHVIDTAKVLKNIRSAG